MVVGELAEHREVIVVGGGPAGYHAALEARKKGYEVLLIEKEQVGGVCLHQGCIPSKLLAETARRMAQARTNDNYGILTEGLSFHYPKYLAMQQQQIKQSEQGMIAACRQAGVERLTGVVRFTSADKIGVERDHQFDRFTYDRLIIATGSYTSIPSFLKKLPEEKVICQEAFYQQSTLPNHCIIDVTHPYALELAHTYLQLGIQATLVATKEWTFEPLIQKEIRRIMKKKKWPILVLEGSETWTVEKEEVVCYSKSGEVMACGELVYTAGVVKPSIESLGLRRYQIACSDEEMVLVNSQFETNLPHIYAIGDVTRVKGNATLAIKEAKQLLANWKDEGKVMDTYFQPLILHTSPPICSVGRKTTELEETKYVVEELPLYANGQQMIQSSPGGKIILVIEKETTIIEGIHMIGEGAIELAGQFVQALEMVARREDFTFPNYGHPTTQEVFN